MPADHAAPPPAYGLLHAADADEYFRRGQAHIAAARIALSSRC